MKNHPAISATEIRRKVLAWYSRHKRDLPWRRTRDPYRIWVSEIMLQQTRVAAVIPYYERFLELFPDAAALASAPEQDLLAAWAGLGYYSRVRNLQKAAKKLLELGGFPRDHPSILELPGVGAYTAAAIASIAFDQRRAVLDGNVIRVLSRLTAERGNVASAAVRRRLQGVADSLLDPRRPGDFNQGLMELGATVCLPKQPECPKCPIHKQCRAHQMGKQNELPLLRPRAGSARVEKQLLVIRKAGKVLVWQRPADSRRLAGFWELPEPGQVPAARIGGAVAAFRHTIVNTSYFFEVLNASLVHPPEGFHWLETKNLHEVPLSTTAKKALACLRRHGADA
ncbi:MAG TPA: A/G-specific adenine glycosylase [Bryobacteraceae bacterium]|nr:A/G-specific adenine glycosylase [Bryobacteraceae bacterium]